MSHVRRPISYVTYDLDTYPFGVICRVHDVAPRMQGGVLTLCDTGQVDSVAVSSEPLGPTH